MNYMQINKFDTANGYGVRVSIFVAGCSFACKGCFNKAAWSYSAGVPFTDMTIYEVVQAADDRAISGLSILGGEPLEPRNVASVLNLVRVFKSSYPDKDIWLWTGYEMHELTERMSGTDGDQLLEELLKHVDTLIDGRYDASKPTSKPYCGSDNQIMWNKQDVWMNGEIKWVAFQKSLATAPVHFDRGN
ncbi:ribonucleotide reductase of class III (anaerobic) activating protein [Yersinia phage vB_YenM_P778]